MISMYHITVIQIMPFPTTLVIVFVSFSTFYYRLTSKHLPCWRCTEDVLKIFRDVCNVIFVCLPRRLQDIIARGLANMSWELLANTSWRRIPNTSWRRLGRGKSVTLKTSSRRLQDVLENKKCLLGSSTVPHLQYQTYCVRVASRVAEQLKLRILEN